MYEKYLELKKINKNALYLFKSGKFYIFLDEDAITINKYTTLKLINHSKEVLKCGFPDNALDKYLSIFENINLNVKLADEIYLGKSDLERYLDKISKLNINELKPIESLNILSKLKDLLWKM